MLRHHSTCWLQSRLVRTLSTTPRFYANHYDVLGLTPKATQGDIKSAYYKLSMQHHPDKSPDAESAKKFRELTEAYEVLGNINLKKMYDKGLLVGKENTSRMEFEQEPEPDDPTLKFYKSRLKRQVMPTMDGRTPIYDFDSWSKNHYGEVFKKSQYERQFVKKKIEKRINNQIAVRQETYMLLGIIIVGLFFIFVVQGKTDYDKDAISRTKMENSIANSNIDSR